jgi:hypothetical protein
MLIVFGFRGGLGNFKIELLIGFSVLQKITKKSWNFSKFSSKIQSKKASQSVAQKVEQKTDK